MIVCIQCALEGFVESDGFLAPGHVNFVQTHGVAEDDTLEAHIARAHPEPITREARAELERKAAEILKRIGGQA